MLSSLAALPAFQCFIAATTSLTSKGLSRVSLDDVYPFDFILTELFMIYSCEKCSLKSSIH